MSIDPRTPKRLTRGTVELRGGTWWNRYREEFVDLATGEIRRRARRLRLGKFRSRAQAAEALERYLALLDPETLQPGVGVTVREVCARFLKLKASILRPTTQRQYTMIVHNYIAQDLGARALASIDGGALQQWIADLHGRGLSRATIEAARGLLLQIIADARTAGFAAHRIARGDTKLPSTTRVTNEPRHIEPRELALIAERAAFPERALWALLGFAGLRIGEGLGLEWRHVDLEAGWIHVRQACVAGRIAPLKTARSNRDVPILPALGAVLAEYRQVWSTNDAGLLFATRRGTPLRADAVRRRRLAPLLAALELRPATCHSFRHGVPDLLDAAGVPAASIQRFMGHASLEQTEHYLHRSRKDLKRHVADAFHHPRPTASEVPE